MRFEESKFVPSKGRVIIKKMKELTKTVKTQEPDYEKAAEEGKDPIKDVMTMKEVILKGSKGIQVGEVVCAHPDDPYKVGQTVAYGIHTIKEFDLFNGKYGLLDAYNVLGVYSE